MPFRAVGLIGPLCLSAAALASRYHYLARDEQLCDASATACLMATLTYDHNPRLLWLRGRVQSAPGPGMLRITLKGSTRQGFVRYAPMEVDLRGRRTEIVDFRMIPDHPDVSDWAIDRVEFEPGKKAR